MEKFAPCQKSETAAVSPFAVRQVRFSSGERFFLLVRTEDGQPLFQPVIYATTIIRQKDRASETIKRNLRAIVLLYAWANSRGIDLEKRMQMGNFLTVDEIDSLARAARMHYQDFLKSVAPSEDPTTAPNALELRYHRIAAGARERSVQGDTAKVTLIYLRLYLEWFTSKALYNLPLRDRKPAQVARDEMLRQIESRCTTGRRYGSPQRIGLTKKTQNLLISCIKPDSPMNPWKNINIRYRNELLVSMLTSLGIRRGEALGITIDRINLGKNEIQIIRNADDPSDPRTSEPNTKTADRLLAIHPGLGEMISHYVTKVRKAIPGATSHNFLFVSHRDGRPLSLSGYSKIFVTLRNRVTGLSNNLSGQLLRHTWNDRFSELMDEKMIPEADEIKLRNENMGWSPTSKAAATYTRRSTREKARKASLQLQNSLTLGRQPIKCLSEVLIADGESRSDVQPEPSTGGAFVSTSAVSSYGQVTEVW